MVTFLRGWCCTRRPYLARTNATGSTALSTSAGIDYADLIFVSKTFTRLYRIGAYPPLRGTLMRLDHRQVVRYTRGSVEFFRTYPGMYVPRLLLLRCQEIGQSLGFLAEEILALSKMNWNNTQFDGGEPITVRASRYVGDILTYVPDGLPMPIAQCAARPFSFAHDPGRL